MRLLNLRIQNFRNIDFAELDLSDNRIFFLGANGQGKSNLLEALGLLMALRSFRTQKNSVLLRQGSRRYAAFYEVEHDVEGRVELELQGELSGRRLVVDGEKVLRLGDFIGRFPVLTLSSGDLMLLRGSPVERRRFMDLTLSVIDADYYHALRNYHHGVAERNRLLKKAGNAGELSAFEAEIAPHAVALVQKRAVGLERLRKALVSTYANIAEADEGPEFGYRVNADCADVESVSRFLRDNRRRDAVIGSTQRGPHRDDMYFSLRIGVAREYASDGQQRGLCVALRIAQARLFEETLGLRPVLLVDDVLGELDPQRQSGFWQACPPEIQIVATGTALPASSKPWRVWDVVNGQFKPRI